MRGTMLEAVFRLVGYTKAILGLSVLPLKRRRKDVFIIFLLCTAAFTKRTERGMYPRSPFVYVIAVTCNMGGYEIAHSRMMRQKEISCQTRPLTVDIYRSVKTK